MSYTGFPVKRSVISSEALAQSVLPRYRIRKLDSCAPLNIGGVNDTYVVHAGRSRYFLRIYRYDWRSRAEIEAEVDMLNYLSRRGNPISHPVKRDGGYLTRIAAPEGTRYAVLITDAPGRNPDFSKLESCRRYGNMVAKLHVDADRRRTDSRRFHLDLSHLIDQPLRHLGPLLTHRPDDCDYLERVGGELRSGIESLLSQTAPEYGFCHGDHHGGNVHEDNQGHMVLFDFDNWGYGWRAYDVGVFLWSHALGAGWERAAKAKTRRRWNAFVEGYEQVRSLTEAERAATKLFVPIRHIWLMWVDTYLQGENWGGGFADHGYFDYHIGFVRQSIKHFRLL